MLDVRAILWLENYLQVGEVAKGNPTCGGLLSKITGSLVMHPWSGDYSLMV